MKKLYFVICGKYRIFVKPITLALSIFFVKSVKMKLKKYLKKNSLLRY